MKIPDRELCFLARSCGLKVTFSSLLGKSANAFWREVAGIVGFKRTKMRQMIGADCDLYSVLSGNLTIGQTGRFKFITFVVFWRTDIPRTGAGRTGPFIAEEFVRIERICRKPQECVNFVRPLGGFRFDK